MFGIDDVALGALTVGGIGLQLFGSNQANQAAQQEFQATQAMIGLEKQQNQVRRQAMELSAQRMNIQSVRDQQMQEAAVRATATGQGAQFGSAIGGGIGQTAGQNKWNQLGVSQNLQIGEHMFNLTDQISDQKIALAQAESEMQTANAWSGLGKMLVGSASPFSKLLGNFFQNSGSVST